MTVPLPPNGKPIKYWITLTNGTIIQGIGCKQFLKGLDPFMKRLLTVHAYIGDKKVRIPI